jgi:hypothetical protein
VRRMLCRTDAVMYQEMPSCSDDGQHVHGNLRLREINLKYVHPYTTEDVPLVILGFSRAPGQSDGVSSLRLARG